jgi:hypothetical protein
MPAMDKRSIPTSPTNKPTISSNIDALIKEYRPHTPKASSTPTHAAQIFRASSPAPHETNWVVTSTFTLPELSHCLNRLCSELNWDWYGQKYFILNTKSTLALNKIWRTMVSAMYEHCCVEMATPEKSVWKVLVQKEGGEEKALRYYRRQVHNMMVFFAHVESRANGGSVVEVVTREGREKLRVFADALLSGGK